MSFEEFLLARDKGMLAEAIRSSYEELVPLPDPVHHSVMQLFREYLLVGGMPSLEEVEGLRDSHGIQRFAARCPEAPCDTGRDGGVTPGATIPPWDVRQALGRQSASHYALATATRLRASKATAHTMAPLPASPCS